MNKELKYESFNELFSKSGSEWANSTGLKRRLPKVEPPRWPLQQKLSDQIQDLTAISQTPNPSEQLLAE